MGFSNSTSYSSYLVGVSEEAAPAPSPPALAEAETEALNLVNLDRGGWVEETGVVEGTG